MRELCREKGVGKSAVYEWIADDEELSGRIARARDVGYDELAEQTLEIADEKPKDAVEVQHAKLRIETRLKLLAKWDPRRYGDKMETTLQGPNGGPIQSAQVVMGVKAEDVPEDVLRWMASNRVENTG